MSTLDRVMEEVSTETTETANPDVTVEVTESGVNDTDNSTEVAAEDTVADKVEKDESLKKDVAETPEASEVPKDTKPTYTKEEQMQYSFKKRLDRQQRKYEEELKSLKEQLSALTAPKPKTRADFGSDEEFVKDYMNNIVAEQLAAKEKTWKEEQAQQESTKAQQEAFNKQISENFDSFDVFNDAVEPALANGLSELISTNPAVNDFITKNACGAKMLYTLATDQAACNRVFTATNMWDQYYALKRIEESFEGKTFKTPATAPVAPAPVTEVKPTVKIIGKVGQSKASDGDWDNKEWLRKQIRGR